MAFTNHVTNGTNRATSSLPYISIKPIVQPLFVLRAIRRPHPPLFGFPVKIKRDSASVTGSKNGAVSLSPIVDEHAARRFQADMPGAHFLVQSIFQFVFQVRVVGTGAICF